MARSQNRQRTSRATPNDVAKINRKLTSEFRWTTFVEQLAINRVKWTGLPETCDARFLEWSLIRDGKALFFDANAGGDEPMIMNSRVTFRGLPDRYYNWHEFIAIATSLPPINVSDEDGVLVWGSMTRRDSWPVLASFVEELVQVDDVARVNREQQKIMPIVMASENSQADLRRFQDGLEEGRPFLFFIAPQGQGTPVFSETVDLSTPYKQRDFNEDRLGIHNRLYTALGIKNVPFEKSQHLLEAEAEIADDVIARIREDVLAPRREAARLANEKWGLDIKVDWASEEFRALKMTPSAHESEPITAEGAE